MSGSTCHSTCPLSQRVLLSKRQSRLYESFPTHSLRFTCHSTCPLPQRILLSKRQSRLYESHRTTCSGSRLYTRTHPNRDRLKSWLSMPRIGSESCLLCNAWRRRVPCGAGVGEAAAKKAALSGGASPNVHFAPAVNRQPRLPRGMTLPPFECDFAA